MALPTVTRAVDAAITEGRVAGAVVLVARDGELVHRQAAGSADLAAGVPMDASAVFRLASVTKPVVAVAAMRLVERGDLDLISPITRWLKDFRPMMPDGTTPAITVDHLLTHTAGLSYRMGEPAGSDYDRAGVSDGLDRTDMSLGENLERIASTRLRFEPGRDFRYSVAYDVLGGVIEQAAGLALPAAIEELVSRPLGMSDFAFSVRDRSRVPTQYGVDLVPITETPIPNEFSVVRMSPDRIFDPAQWPSGGAGAAGTADDILRFLDAIAHGGGPVLQPRTVEQMYVGRIERRLTPTVRDTFARGWAVVSADTSDLFGLPPGAVHWGGAYGHSWSIDPATRTVVVALTNTAPEGTSGAFPSDVARAAYADLPD